MSSMAPRRIATVVVTKEMTSTAVVRYVHMKDSLVAVEHDL